jgi:hypothetical protein
MTALAFSPDFISKPVGSLVVMTNLAHILSAAIVVLEDAAGARFTHSLVASSPRLFLVSTLS